MDWHLFLSTFALIFIAEFPDKTALATVTLAASGSPLPVFMGVAIAFLIQTCVAVFFGTMFAAIPGAWMHLISGFLFVVFAFLAWKKSREFSLEGEASDQELGGAARKTFWQTALGAFIVIFIAEWGDLTQLATASLVMRYHKPLTLFLAAILALWSATAVAVWLGSKAKHILNPRRLQQVAAILFLSVGCYLIWDWTRGG